MLEMLKPGIHLWNSLKVLKKAIFSDRGRRKSHV